MRKSRRDLGHVLLTGRVLRSTARHGCRPLTTSGTIDGSRDNPPPSSHVSESFLTPQPQTLHSYRTTTPPNVAQLSYAHKFFARSPSPKVLWTTPTFRTMPVSRFPEVCFLGRSNVGKSSLLNALFGRPRQQPANVSKKPGRTRTMNAYAVGKELEVRYVGDSKTGGYVTASHGGDKGVLVVVDMPGYGAASREEWGVEIMKYLENRKQLRRTFVLVDATHGLKQSDTQILRHLAEKGIGHQILLSKVDKLIMRGRRAKTSSGHMSGGLKKLRDVIEDIQQALNFGRKGIPRALGDILSCSAEKSIPGSDKGKDRIGIREVQWAVLSACGLDCDPYGAPRKNAEASSIILESKAL